MLAGGGLVVGGCTRVAAAEEQGLAWVIKQLGTRHKGQVALVVKRLDSGRGFAWQAERPMPTASSTPQSTRFASRGISIGSFGPQALVADFRNKVGSGFIRKPASLALSG